MDNVSYALISKDILERILDLNQIFTNSNIIASQEEGVVYLTAITSLGGRYILKRRNIYIEESMYETRVGMELNKINHPNLVKTYMYFQCPCDWLDETASFILMEYIEGIPYSKLREQLTSDQRKLFLRHLCMIIVDIQSKIKFTQPEVVSPYMDLPIMISIMIMLWLLWGLM